MIKILLTIVVILFITISYLLHQINGVNLYAWYVLGGSLVILRTLRSVLLIKTK